MSEIGKCFSFKDAVVLVISESDLKLRQAVLSFLKWIRGGVIFEVAVGVLAAVGQDRLSWLGRQCIPYLLSRRLERLRCWVMEGALECPLGKDPHSFAALTCYETCRYVMRRRDRLAVGKRRS